MTFDMSQAWREAVAMIKANQEVLLIVAGVFFFLPALATALLLPEMRTVLTDGNDPGAAVLRLYTDYWWLFLLVIIVQTVGTLTLLTLLRDRAKPTVGDALRSGGAGFLPYIVATFLFSVAVALVFGVLVGILAAVGGKVLAALGALIAIIVAIWFMVRMSMMPPVVGIERVFNPILILRRSWDLTRSHALRLFLFFLLIGIAYFVISIVVGLLTALIGVLFGTAFAAVVDAVISSAFGAAATVVFVAVLAAVHRQLAAPEPEAPGAMVS